MKKARWKQRAYRLYGSFFGDVYDCGSSTPQL